MTLTRTYSDNSTHEPVSTPRARLGGPRLPHTAGSHDDLIERFTTGAIFGSHMPLDTDAHWDWRNPLNLIPAMILLLFVIAFYGPLLLIGLVVVDAIGSLLRNSESSNKNA